MTLLKREGVKKLENKRIEELLNRKPKGWRNVTIKEFERDIKHLQSQCRSMILELEETKEENLIMKTQLEGAMFYGNFKLDMGETFEFENFKGVEDEDN